MKSVKTPILVPPSAEIRDQARFAARNGIGLRGSGPFRVVTGGLPYVVGPCGCTCPDGRVGLWCQHRSIFVVATGTMPKPSPSRAVADRAKQDRPMRPQRLPRSGRRRLPVHA